MANMDKLLPLAATAAGYYFGGPLGAAAGGLAGSVASGALAEAPSATPAPAPSVTPPVPMSDPKATGAAKKRSIAEMMARRGRASTILTDPASSDALGG